MSQAKKGKRAQLRPIANANYRKKPEEFESCRSPGCPNVIARWIRGSGYCTPCRKKRM